MTKENFIKTILLSGRIVKYAQDYSNYFKFQIYFLNIQRLFKNIDLKGNYGSLRKLLPRYLWYLKKKQLETKYSDRMLQILHA